jgi:hypothetical protein
MTARHHARYSRLVMKPLQQIHGASPALAMFLAIFGMTTTSRAQSPSVAPASSADEAIERLGCSGVFDDADEACPSATSASTSASPGDDRIRWLTFYLIYTDGELSRHAPGGAMGARFDIFQFAGLPGLQPYGYPIHIVVRSARTRLVGVVRATREKRIAGLRAREAPGVLAVENALIVARQEELR